MKLFFYVIANEVKQSPAYAMGLLAQEYASLGKNASQ